MGSVILEGTMAGSHLSLGVQEQRPHHMPSRGPVLGGGVGGRDGI